MGEPDVRDIADEREADRLRIGLACEIAVARGIRERADAAEQINLIGCDREIGGGAGAVTGGAALAPDDVSPRIDLRL